MAHACFTYTQGKFHRFHRGVSQCVLWGFWNYCKISIKNLHTFSCMLACKQTKWKKKQWDLIIWNLAIVIELSKIVYRFGLFKMFCILKYLEKQHLDKYFNGQLWHYAHINSVYVDILVLNFVIVVSKIFGITISLSAKFHRETLLILSEEVASYIHDIK